MKRLKRIVRDLITKDLEGRGKIVISLNDEETRRVFALVRKVRGETKMKLSDAEGYYLHAAATMTAKIPGEIAEVGTFRGASSKIIAEAKGRKPLHLFDTFEGLPELSETDDAVQLRPGSYAAPLDEVRKLLSPYPNVSFYKGIFPTTADPVKDTTFSFVHLDVDLYGSTLEGIRFFYPRMAKGGVMISHDYPNLQGVKRAFDEFFADKPEIVIPLLGCRQCLVVKV